MVIHYCHFLFPYQVAIKNLVAMITEEILKVSRSTGKDILVVFGDFLDYCIDCFTPPRPIPDGIDKNSVFFNAFASLQIEYLKGISNHGCYDPLGDVFMDLTKGIQSYRGQFFTPPSICDMMCNVTVGNFAYTTITSCGAFGERVICNDPACGSSRNLIALASKYINKPRKELPYFIGEDIDATCCKMSAINMCVHGIPGEVVCHDALAEPDTLRFGYVINETTYPLYTGVPSIRRFEDKRRFVLFSTRKSEKI